MTDVKEFHEIAAQIAEQLHAQTSDLQKELADIETRKVLINSQLESAKLGVKRLLDFKPVIDGQYQCPRCFIRSGKRAIVKPIASDIDVLDAWRCTVCSFEFTTDT